MIENHKSELAQNADRDVPERRRGRTSNRSLCQQEPQNLALDHSITGALSSLMVTLLQQALMSCSHIRSGRPLDLINMSLCFNDERIVIRPDATIRTRLDFAQHVVL
jgi:hypothetical protein